MNRTPDEYMIYPVDEQTIISWIDRRPDYPHPIEIAVNSVVAVVMHPPSGPRFLRYHSGNQIRGRQNV